MADVADWSPWVSRLRLNSKVLRGVYEVPAGSARLTPMEGIRGLAVAYPSFCTTVSERVMAQ